MLERVSSLAAPFRVVIADDEPHSRLLARLQLGIADGFEVVGEAQDGASAIALVHSSAPDFLVIDLDMPGMDGMSAIRLLLDKPVRPGIVAFTAGTTRATVAALQTLGVEVVYKDADPDLLIEALHRSRNGRP